MNFDRLAPFYQTMERLAAGRKLQRCRVALLGEIPVPRKVLILGEGRGGFLLECLNRFPDCAFTVIDSSRVMLDLLEKRIGNEDLKRVHLIHVDLIDWQPPLAGFDLIVTHFFLDCFAPQTLAGIIHKLSTAAASQANWLVADFQLANGRFRNLRSRWILWSLYRFFRLSCKLEARSLTPPDAFLRAAGFERWSHLEFDWGLLKSEGWRR